VSAWITPALAAVFWAGLLVQPRVGELVDPWVWLSVGGGLLGAALALAPGRTETLTSLERAGLVTTAAGDLRAAVAPAPIRKDRTVWTPLPLPLALAGSLLLAIGWGSVHEHRVLDAVLARISAPVTVEGSLRVDPSVELDRWSAMLDVRSVRWDEGGASVRETVWLSGRDEPPDAVRGDRLRVSGSVRPVDDAGFASFLLRRGIVAELEVDEAERLGPAAFAPVRWAQSFRALAGRSIESSFPPREAGLLMGLALGDDSRLDPGLERDFRATGLSHLLVVSGENVAMVLAPIVALGAALGWSRWPRFALGMGTVAFFVVLTGAEPSVMRAGVMAGLALIGVVLGRPRSTGSILGGAVVVLLVLDPALVWSVGFQLSVAATASMVALATPISTRLRFLPASLSLAAGATLAAQVGVTPLLLFYFHEVPVSTVAANVLAFPAVAPALLLGQAAATIGIVLPAAGHLISILALVPMRYLETVADRLARAPIPWITGGGALTLILGLVVAALLAWWLRAGRRLPRRAFVGVLASLPLLVWTNAISAGPPSALTVRFFDVGQGDSALLTSPGGVAILVDGGPDPAQVATELAALGVKRLDLIVASHPHADHVVGLPAVLARFPVGLLLEPGCRDDSPDGAALDEATSGEHIAVRYPRAGDVFQVGDVRLEILSPDRCWSGTESDTNNDAIVVRANIGEDSVLFATEPEEPAQQVLLDEGLDLHADVLKVPHHGAATSIEPFFEAVDAEVAVVSVGPNTYGHPVPEVLDWIRATGAEVFRTDRAGTVTVTFEHGGAVVESGA
jgi:DNA internalization-related competence protein ComEC/Rec2